MAYLVIELMYVSCTGCKSSLYSSYWCWQSYEEAFRILRLCEGVPYNLSSFLAYNLHALTRQEYRTTALLGCETDSFDNEGAVVRVAHWKHVTQESVEKALPTFRGDIKQKPPMYAFSFTILPIVSRSLGDSLH